MKGMEIPALCKSKNSEERKFRNNISSTVIITEKLDKWLNNLNQKFENVTEPARRFLSHFSVCYSGRQNYSSTSDTSSQKTHT